jgi:Bacterial SH3 domain
VACFEKSLRSARKIRCYSGLLFRRWTVVLAMKPSSDHPFILEKSCAGTTAEPWRSAPQGLRFTSLLPMIILLLVGPALARGHERYGEGLAVDVDAPYEKTVKAVQAVAENGVIQGTWQYRGTSELGEASAAKTASGFKDWDGKGAVFYKVRPGAIAPEHFYATGDQGTVSVRYIVEPGGPNLTHLRIDAIYQEDNGHRSHASDGQVENSEFAVIGKQLDDMDEAEKKRRQQEIIKEQEDKLEALQTKLKQENAALKAATTKREQLKQELREQQGVRLAHISKATADVKALPYNESKTLQLLSQGDAVTVLRQTPAWYEVRTAGGQDGWVYHLMLDVAP